MTFFEQTGFRITISVFQMLYQANDQLNKTCAMHCGKLKINSGIASQMYYKEFKKQNCFCRYN